ncbi:response regulator transcription factor [Pseudomonas sp. SZMC_28357]|uniref:response regulator transcription factor n=1 Tax=Pseudomonas sp. SZMC_28357 TaxID=3074380 RepID=UPI0028719C9A|nr:response regulator transcription factor [Pseudomonas sp. SZMC_28357]MDR9749997.1 response regulator transcription factor [Pseudomonas sp. SZMC_28357]
MKKVLIVDDHPVIRAAVKIILKQENVNVIYEASNGVDAVQIVREHLPDLVILDLVMPGLDGLDVLARIKAAHVNVRTLVFTSQDPSFYLNRCMRAGALAYVAKVNHLQELQKAIHAVMSGYTYYPRLPASSVSLDSLQRNERQMIDKLSDRELTIFLCLAQGMSNKEIAATMMLSHKTVSTYKTRLIEKLNVPSAVCLRELAKRNHLI